MHMSTFRPRKEAMAEGPALRRFCDQPETWVEQVGGRSGQVPSRRRHLPYLRELVRAEIPDDLLARTAVRRERPVVLVVGAVSQDEPLGDHTLAHGAQLLQRRVAAEVLGGGARAHHL